MPSALLRKAPSPTRARFEGAGDLLAERKTGAIGSTLMLFVLQKMARRARIAEHRSCDRAPPAGPKGLRVKMKSTK